MQTQEVTYHVKLVASSIDGLGYINYVFENLEFQDYDYQYIMCVRFPNWNQGTINYDDVGYVTVKYVREGIDKWYDGSDFNVYRYTNVIFLKFIHEKAEIKPSEILLD